MAVCVSKPRCAFATLRGVVVPDAESRPFSAGICESVSTCSAPSSRAGPDCERGLSYCGVGMQSGVSGPQVVFRRGEPYDTDWYTDLDRDISSKLTVSDRFVRGCTQAV